MKNLKFALRHLLTSKINTLINIVGFSISIATCLLILIYIVAESNYDTFHQHKSGIYRVITAQHAASPAILGPSAQQDIPEINNFTRIRSPYVNMLIKVNGEYFTEEALSFRYIDDNFFNIFSFTLLKGRKDDLVNSQEKIVLSESTARKYFGDKDPIGQTLSVENFIPGFSTHNFVVSGVVEDPPLNSHIQFHILASLRLFEALEEKPLNNWKLNWVWTYFRLDNTAVPDDVEKKLNNLVATHIPDPTPLQLQPLQDIYLRSESLRFPIGKTGNINNVIAFSFIGLLILLAAIANFVNLNIAGSIRRTQEIGIKKVLGSTRTIIIRQFLSESLILTALSAMIALGLTALITRYSENLLGLKFQIDDAHILYFALALVVMILISSVTAGLFPTLYLARSKVSDILGNRRSHKRKGQLAQRLLIVFQFSTSIFIISAILIISDQLDMIRNKPLGFEREHILVIPCEIDLRSKLPLLKKELLANASIDQVGASSRPPGYGGIWNQVYRMQGVAFSGDEYVDMGTYHVGPDFISTMGMKILQGRTFSSRIKGDSAAFLINESARTELIKWGGDAWKNPLGKTLDVAPGRARPNVYKSGPIIGVVEDFHFNTLFEKVGPLALTVNYTPLKTLVVKVAGNNIDGALALIRDKWEELNIEWPFEYSFLDQEYMNLYQNELRSKRLLEGFAVITMVLSCLGLWGLVLALIEQKRKDISIRKVLGSSLINLLILQTRRYIILVLLASMVSLPLSWYIMQDWLSDFAYRIQLEVSQFAIPSGIALVGVLLTITYVCVKAAKANPIKYLRSE